MTARPGRPPNVDQNSYLRDDAEAQTWDHASLRDGEEYCVTLQRDFDGEIVRTAELRRYGEAAKLAAHRLATGKLLREAPEDQRIALLSALNLVVSAAKGQTPPEEDGETAFWSAEAFRDAIEPVVAQFARDHDEFRERIETEGAGMAVGDLIKMRAVLRDIATGHDLVGIEQSECFRSARNSAFDLANGAEKRHPLPWLLLGWLCMWNGSATGDAIGHLANGISLTVGKRDFVSYLLNRYLALALELTGRHLEAFETGKIALGARTDSRLLLEVARYGVRCGHVEEAAGLVGEVVLRDPLAFALVLASPELAPVHGAVAGAMARAAGHLRRATESSIREWTRAVERIRAAETLLGQTLAGDDPVIEELAVAVERAPNADLLEGLGLLSECRRSAAEASALAAKRLTAEQEHRRDDVELVKLQIDEAETKRVSALETARRQEHAMLAGARTASGYSSAEGERTSQGCMVSLGLACGMFLCYVVAAAIARSTGANFGPDTSIGELAIAACAAPLFIAFAAQFAFAVKRMSLESQTASRAVAARAAFEKAVSAIDKSFDERQTTLVAALDLAEKQIVDAEAAAKLLAGGDASAKAPASAPEPPEGEASPSEQRAA